ncbi:hypothetical protein R3P38DRAFT_2799176 [Favolaschia claudopus]|uniref:Uncharacterized protein n=1 Tax=Favolaschia claudopus TaxID=2862362 RepID=A0AAW0A092_9AGAR
MYQKAVLASRLGSVLNFAEAVQAINRDPFEEKMTHSLDSHHIYVTPRRLLPVRPLAIPAVKLSDGGEQIFLRRARWTTPETGLISLSATLPSHYIAERLARVLWLTSFATSQLNWVNFEFEATRRAMYHCLFAGKITPL